MDKLTLPQANKIIETALSTARQRGHRPMAVVVLDDSGHVRSVQREDGASMFRIEIATGKAWAAVSMGASSRTLNERARDNPIFYGALHRVNFWPRPALSSSRTPVARSWGRWAPAAARATKTKPSAWPGSRRPA